MKKIYVNKRLNNFKNSQDKNLIIQAKLMWFMYPFFLKNVIYNHANLLKVNNYCGFIYENVKILQNIF